MTLTMEKKMLYINTYCAYREETVDLGLKCKHIYSYKVCDLDICPIAQEYYANIIFQPDGIYLITKEPSDESIAGKWTKTKIEIDLDNPQSTIETVREKTKGINQKNMEALLNRLNNIIERYKFLKEKGKPVPILEEEVALLPEEEEEEVEEGLEALEEFEELEEGEGEGIEEETLALEEPEEDLDLLDLDDE